MDALVMCGGRGTRLDAPTEKPLFEVGGVPMVGRVLDALAGSRVEGVTAVASPHVPATREYLRERDADVLVTDGEGYVADLGRALDARETRPVLTVVADLPLLAPDAVNRVLDAHDGGDRTVCVPTALKEALGVSADATRAAPRATDRANGTGERDATDGSREPSDPRAGAHGGRDVAPTGLNVVGDRDDETLHVAWDARLAVNVNYADDAAVAEVLADGA